jgi:glycosyltransferase involved in cell wall biosynthesis
MTPSRVIVMPAHNEAEHLPEVLSDWVRFGQAPLILVLDQCTDPSESVVAQALHRGGWGLRNDGSPGAGQVWRPINPQQPPWMWLCVVPTAPHGLGKTGAVLQGLWAALGQGVPVMADCCLWDADGEYDLSALPALWAARDDLEQSGGRRCMVVGERTGQKLLRSVLANGLIRVALRLRTGRSAPRDVLTAVRIAPVRDLLLALHGARKFAMETQIVRGVLDAGLTVCARPVDYAPRIVGKKIGARDLPGLLWAALR